MMHNGHGRFIASRVILSRYEFDFYLAPERSRGAV